MRKIFLLIAFFMATSAQAYVLDQSGRADSLRIPKGKVWLTAMTRQDTTFHDSTLILPVFSSAPSTALWMKGAFYYNSADGNVYKTNGTIWESLATGAGFVVDSRQVLSGEGTKGGGPLTGDVTIEFDCSEAIGSATSATCAGEVIVFDTELDAISSVTSAADKLPYFTGSGTATVTAFTAAGRALVDDADATAQRATLQLGSLATSNSVSDNDWSGTDLAVVNGGTGASDAATAATNLGLGAASSVTFGAVTIDNLIINNDDIQTNADNGDVIVGASDDFSFGHTGTVSYIHNINNNGAWIVIDNSSHGEGVQLDAENDAGTNVTMATFDPDGGSTLTYSGTTKLTISTTGIDVTGSIAVTDASTSRTNLGLVIGTDVQAYDAELAAIAGLVSAADRLPYFTGLGTASLAIFTAAGRAVIDDADATAQRATLGLVIGTNVQAWDADLDDLADGSLTGSKVGTGIAAGNVTTGTLPNTVLDAELSSIAGVTSAADRVPYYTGLGTATVATFTTAGRALVDDADATAQRVTLGLVIGTNVQAWDADLDDLADGSLTGSKVGTGISASNVTTGTLPNTVLDVELSSIAGLTSAADRLPYYTGLGTATLATFTAAGRALIDDADATAQRTTLGLGTIATQNSNTVSITGGSVTGITDLAVADGGTGASVAATAATNLGLGTASSVTFGALTVDNTTLDANDLQTNSDTGELYVGASDDFIFDHNGTISTVHNNVNNAAWIVIDNSSHGEGVRFDAENDAGTNVVMMTLDPDGASTLTNAGTVKLTTETAGIAITGTASGSDPVDADDFTTKSWVEANAGGGGTWYRETDAWDGTNADTGCDAGYHMCYAGEWIGRPINEALHVPSGERGWFDTATNTAAANANSDCNNWTSNSSSFWGPDVIHDQQMSTSVFTHGSTGFSIAMSLCNNTRTIMCCSD